MGFLGGSVVKSLPANAGDGGLFPGLGECPGQGALWTTVQGVTEADTTEQLNTQSRR